jgi:N-acyl-D-aspartate/D-glutamate deacylase
MGLSDAGAHCGAVSDGSMSTTSLALWTRDRTRGEKLPIEMMVHHITQRTAAHVGWLDRGVLAPGYLADVNVIDMRALKLGKPWLAFDLPAGGRRLLQKADGYVATIKSGRVTFREGAMQGPTPGGLVRGPQKLAARDAAARNA